MEYDILPKMISIVYVYRCFCTSSPILLAMNLYGHFSFKAPFNQDSLMETIAQLLGDALLDRYPE